MYIDNISIYLHNKYNQFKFKNYNNKLFQYQDLVNNIKKYKNICKITKIGLSIENRYIFELSLHTNDINKKKIFIWSQMHGNETTGTLSIFDILNFFNQKNELSYFLKKKFNFYFLPMVNPDGAEKFIRYNAIGIDINRDARLMRAPETKILFERIYFHKPFISYNLHDKRSIFNIKNTKHPSIISFLSPSQDVNKAITNIRKFIMDTIVNIYNELVKIIPNNIGRFSDEFYPTATGDNLHKQGYPCILFEAGYCNKDLFKIKTRKYNSIALLTSFYKLSIKSIYLKSYKNYFKIPENDIKMIDEIYKNVTIEKNKKKFIIDIGVIFKEVYRNGVIHHIKKIHKIGDLNEFYPRKKINVNFKNIVNKKNKKKYINLNDDIENFIFI